VQLPDLLLDIHVPHCLDLLLAHHAIISQRCLLASSSLFFSNGLACSTVKQITSLRGEALEIIGDINGGEIGCGETGLCFGFLFFPAGVEEFDFMRMSVALFDNVEGKREGRLTSHMFL